MNISPIRCKSHYRTRPSMKGSERWRGRDGGWEETRRRGKTKVDNFRNQPEPEGDKSISRGMLRLTARLASNRRRFFAPVDFRIRFRSVDISHVSLPDGCGNVNTRQRIVPHAFGTAATFPPLSPQSKSPRFGINSADYGECKPVWPTLVRENNMSK